MGTDGQVYSRTGGRRWPGGSIPPAGRSGGLALGLRRGASPRGRSSCAWTGGLVVFERLAMAHAPQRESRGIAPLAHRAEGGRRRSPTPGRRPTVVAVRTWVSGAKDGVTERGTLKGAEFVCGTDLDDVRSRPGAFPPRFPPGCWRSRSRGRGSGNPLVKPEGLMGQIPVSVSAPRRRSHCHVPRQSPRWATPGLEGERLRGRTGLEEPAVAGA